MRLTIEIGLGVLLFLLAARWLLGWYFARKMIRGIGSMIPPVWNEEDRARQREYLKRGEQEALAQGDSHIVRLYQKWQESLERAPLMDDYIKQMEAKEKLPSA